MSNDGRRSVMYIRVNVLGQEGVNSCEWQQSECLKLAEELGGTVDPEDVFRDIGSGLSLELPELSKLMELVASGKVDAVLVYSFARLSRNRVHLRKLLRECRKRGVVVFQVRR